MRLILIALSLTTLAGAAPPTFSKDVAPIFFEHCASCHRPKSVAPMSLLDYKSARPWAKAIRQAVTLRKMPPWFADPKHGDFANDARLTPKQVQTIQAWVDANAPEGNSADLPPAPKFEDGWQLGKPDLVVDIGQDFQVQPGEDAYVHFTVPVSLTEGRWIRAAEIRPGNREVVHHVHVNMIPVGMGTGGKNPLDPYLEKEGSLTRIRMDAPVVNDACAADIPDLPFLREFQEGALASYLPGRPPDAFAAGTAKWIPAGTSFEFVVHYAKVRAPQVDRTSVGLYFYPGTPEKRLRRMDLRNFFMRIEPNAPAHEVRRCYTFDKDRLLLSITPHFHYRGKDVTYEIEKPDGGREILLRVPNYDFNWQLVYRFRDPKLVKQGSRIIVTTHYDNSRNNPANPNPGRAIRWGDKTEEEMMTSWIEYLDR